MATHARAYKRDSAVQLLKPATYTSDQNSTSVDMQGFQELTIVAAVGLSGDTLSGALYINLELEHSDDNSTFTDCSNDEVSSYVTSDNTGTFAKIDAAAEDEIAVVTAYKGSKRYVRVVLNVVGTHSNGTPVAIVAIKGLPSATTA